MDSGASADFRDSALSDALDAVNDVYTMKLGFIRYLLKWSIIISVPIPLVWMLFSMAHYLPWHFRAILIWGGIWLPLVVLSAAVDYARVHGGGLGFFGFKRKKKKKEEDEYYEQKSALDATIEANL